MVLGVDDAKFDVKFVAGLVLEPAIVFDPIFCFLTGMVLYH